MPTHKLAATNQPLQDDTTDLLKTYLYNNYNIGDPAKDTAVKFDVSFQDLSNPGFLVVVIPLTKLNIHAYAGKDRKMIEDYKRVYVMACGSENLDKHWIVEEAIYDIIDCEPEGLIGEGIEDMTITDFTPITTHSNQQLLAMIGDGSLIKASYARAKLVYDKVL